MALASRIDYLWLEGDSLNIIKHIKGHTMPSWMIAKIIKDLKFDLGKFKKTFISHVFREANLIANWFANDAITRNLEMMWKIGDGLLAAVIELIRQDRI